MTSPSESPSPYWRERNEDGHQLVVVDYKYTWIWCGTPDLRVGSHVVLPGNPWTHGYDYRGEVTAIGSDYLGPMRRILDEETDPTKFPTWDQLMLW
jgi:hypothetical protein